MDKLIRFSPSVNFNPFNGRTPLHLIIDSGKMNKFIWNCDENFEKNRFVYVSALDKVVAILIKNGADINVEDNSGRTPLHTAAHSGIRLKINSKWRVI